MKCNQMSSNVMKCPTESEYVQRWPTPKSLLQGFSSFTRPLVELSRRKPAIWSLIFTGHISHIMSYHVIVIHYPCRCSLRAANGSVTLNCRARFNFTTCSLDKANWKQKHETHWNKSNQSTFHKCYSRSFTVYYGCFGLHCASNRIENDPSLKLSCWSSISDALTSTSSTPSASSSSLKVDLTAWHLFSAFLRMLASLLQRPHPLSSNHVVCKWWKIVGLVHPFWRADYWLW